MVSHVPYIITFQLTNPDSRLDPSVSHADAISGSVGFVPPAIVRVSAQGTATIPESQMIYPNQALLSIVNGTNPLVLLLFPMWYDAQVSQSNPLASEPNNITIQFSTNIDLRGSDEAVITVSGLRNARGNSSVPLVSGNGSDLIFDRQTPGYAVFNPSDGNTSIEMHVQPNATVKAGVLYLVVFQIVNPPFDQEPQNIFLAAGGEDTSIIVINIAPTLMTVHESCSLSIATLSESCPSKWGKSMGLTVEENHPYSLYQPMYVIVPRFLISKIGQKTPIAGTSNTIIVTFQVRLMLWAATQLQTNR